MIKPLPSFHGLTITFNTTEDCNLRCKYCYETNKKSKYLDSDTAYKFIDLILDQSDKLPEKSRSLLNEGVIMDFIGGDPLVDVRLLDDIITYFLNKLIILNHPSKYKFRVSMSTNGTLFKIPEVRQFCEKYSSVMSLGVSIDGCPELHDLNRVYPDGRGSFNDIMDSWDWYKSVFPVESKSTKSTLSKDSIPYIFKSLKFMHEDLEMMYINQNFIMEDMQLDDDDLKKLDSELEKCVYYVLDHCDDLNWSMISRKFLIRNPNHQLPPEEPMCGSGCMPALGINGNIYPCFRWLPHSQSTDFNAGDVNQGIKADILDLVSQGSLRSNITKENKCLTCEYEPCCSYCTAGCFSEFGDFIRTTHICEVTKLQCKWAEVYWNLYEDKINTK